MESYAQQKRLNQNQITENFIKVSSDTYALKKFLLAQLPRVTYKSQEPRLKMLIVDSGCSLNTQILRLEIAMKQLQKNFLTSGSLTADGLNFEKYLLQDIDSVSLYNDAKLLNHLLLIVGIEVNSFRVLSVLSKPLYPRSVHQLMKLNLAEATKYQTKLLLIYNTYLEFKCDIRRPIT